MRGEREIRRVRGKREWEGASERGETVRGGRWWESEKGESEGGERGDRLGE